MSIYLTPEPSRFPSYHHKVWGTDDTAFIENIIARGLDSDKASMAERNPNLSEKHLETLANDASPYVRSCLARRETLSPALLAQLLADKAEEVRVSAVSNPLTDFSVFKNAVLNGKFSARSKKMLCDHYRVLENAEIFEFLWKTVRFAPKELIYRLNWAYMQNHTPIDPKCVEIVHEEMRSGTPNKSLREIYMRSNYIATDPEILDMFKDDPSREVINSIARNTHAWVSTHEYLASKHKTPLIRMAISWTTDDNALLNKIYHGTKNEEIRRYVEQNTAFVNLHP